MGPAHVLELPLLIGSVWYMASLRYRSVERQVMNTHAHTPHTHTTPPTHTQEAEVLANKDKSRLLQSRKLALIIDLDQTLIHTSVDPNIEPGLPVRTYNIIYSTFRLAIIMLEPIYEMFWSQDLKSFCVFCGTLYM